MNRNTIIAAFFALVFLGGQCALAQSGYNLFQKGLVQERVKGDLDGAIKIYERIIVRFPENRPIVAKALLHMGLCYEKMGKQEAQRAYQRLVQEYADQLDVATQARTRLAEIERKDDNLGVTVRNAWDSIQSIMGEMAVSPDGRYLSFCNLENGNLAIRDLATGKNRDITDDATWYGAQSHAINSAWSPDGKQVACRWSGGGHSGLRIVNLDGSQTRDLYDNTLRPTGPLVDNCYDWSEDGKNILVTLTSKTDANKRLRGIGLISAADGSLLILKSPASNLKDWPGMNLSPDGRYVAYDREVKEHEGLRDIFLLATDGSGKEVRLTEHPADDFHPVWAPDGKAIVFVSDRDPGGIGLFIRYLVDDTSLVESKLVKREVGEVLPLGFTRKGSLFYTTTTRWSHIYKSSLDIENRKVLTPPTLLLRSEGFNMMPAWSPDGKSLAYISERSSLGAFGRRTVLVIRSVESGEERELLSGDPEQLFLGRLRWSPDGRSILYGATWEPLSLIDIQTGHITKIATTDSRIRERLWSPDGKTIYYIGKNVRNEVGSWPSRVVALDSETHQLRELYKEGHTGNFLAISPDGRQLAFCDIYFDGEKSEKVTLKVIPTTGGEARTLFNLRDLGLNKNEWFYGPLLWTPDGHYLLFVKEKRPIGFPSVGPSELWRVPVEHGEPQKLMEIESLFQKGNLMNPISLHPDGKLIAFHKGELKQMNLWVMENFQSETSK